MKILYYALGTQETASSRLRVYKIADELRILGHGVDVKISSADRVLDYDLVVVQKRMDLLNHMVDWIKEVPIIFDIDDPIEPPEAGLPKHNLMTVGSRVLAGMYSGTYYIPDCLDIDDLTNPKIKHSKTLSKICWFGLGCNLYNAEPVYKACEELGLILVVITDTKGKNDYPRWEKAEYINWELGSVDTIIKHCDLVVCPYVTTGHWKADWIGAKGENRILKAWGLGMPVAGTPIPSYVEHGLHHQATTEIEWIEVLQSLKSKVAREADAIAGRKRALKRTSDKVVELWLDAFFEVMIWSDMRDYKQAWIDECGKQYRQDFYDRTHQHGSRPLTDNPTTIELFNLLEAHNPKSILEIGCGFGRFLEPISKAFASLCPVCGCDVSIDMLSLCPLDLPTFYWDICEKPLSEVQYPSADWRSLFGDHFDVGYSRGVFMYFTDEQMEKAMKHVADCIGKVMIVFEWEEVCERMQNTYIKGNFEYHTIEKRDE